jgi:hypothetical protein
LLPSSSIGDTRLFWITRVEIGRQSLKHTDRRATIVRGHRAEGCVDRGFDGVRPRGIGANPARGQMKNRTAAVAWIIDPAQQTLRHEPLQDTRQCTGVHMQDPGEVAGRQPGEKTNDPEHESLRTSDTQVAGHTLGRALESVHNGPKQLHELQDIRQG